MASIGADKPDGSPVIVAKELFTARKFSSNISAEIPEVLPFNKLLLRCFQV